MLEMKFSNFHVEKWELKFRNTPTSDFKVKLTVLLAGDSKVLGFVVQLLKYINKQKHSSRWYQGKGDSSLISNDSFSGEVFFWFSVFIELMF